MRDQITEEQAKTILDEITQPLFATDEGQHFLKGQERLDRIRSILSEHKKPASEHLRQLTLKFMWEDISPFIHQAELHGLFAKNSCLQNPELLVELSPILTSPAATSEEGQANVKKVLCDCFGLLAQKRPDWPTEEESKRFITDVEEIFKDQPGKYEAFVRAGFGPWRGDMTEYESRIRQIELLEGHDDLVERLEKMSPAKRLKDESGVVAS